ncbi:MAG: hypothetical protein LBT46_15305 [Planctomycetaceae bacterium]|jgi:hypothetical protein|nr:hypothetical protein [Planctomycetaceae bacterium]
MTQKDELADAINRIKKLSPLCGGWFWIMLNKTIVPTKVFFDGGGEAVITIFGVAEVLTLKEFLEIRPKAVFEPVMNAWKQDAVEADELNRHPKHS